MIIKCKMCGGDIQFNPGDTCGQCDHCGCTSTLPKLPDDQRTNLFNRANHFRRQCEFDKAMAAYEHILEADDTDAEAHWGVVLSKFGIEYVEDPVTHERIPTCHRAQVVSILSDEDYQNAIKYAPDTQSREIYEQEAKRIAEIQKGILAISSQEKPYDVFICYKETDDSGSRTKDSALAQEIYYQLTNEGYKVFFSRITLEDKLGQEYEPYIFAALNSAKVMLVVGTKPENFSAVWVKNEWSRFLAIMKNDRKRVLIPCYRDMDPYDLPEELSSLQSQDMSKIGFVQDLIHGVKKVLGSDKQSVPNVTVQSAGPGVASLHKRAVLFLEDSDWDSATEYFDRILDIDPEYAPAYIGKVQVKNKVRREADLARCREPISTDADYQKALRFADEKQKAIYEGYNRAILDRIALERKEAAYREAVALESRAAVEADFLAAAQKFDSAEDIRDAKERAANCRAKASAAKAEAEKAAAVYKEQMERERKEREKQEEERRLAEEKRRAEEAERLRKEEALRQEKKKRTIKICSVIAAVAVLIIGGYFVYNKVIQPKMKYDQAQSLLNDGKYDEAYSSFEAIGDYSDSSNKLLEINYRKAEGYLAEKDFANARKYFALAGAYSDANQQIQNIDQYITAQTDYESGNLISAGEKYKNLGNFSDAETQFESISSTLYTQAKTALESKNYQDAFDLLTILGDYSDCPALMAGIDEEYNLALQHWNDGEKIQAEQELQALIGWREATDKLSALRLEIADDAVHEKNYDQAITYYNKITNRSETIEEKLKTAVQGKNYTEGIAQLSAGELNSALEKFTAAGEFEDATTKAAQITAYQQAESYVSEGKYQEARAIYLQLGDYLQSTEMLESCNAAIYSEAAALKANGDYAKANELFVLISGYSDSADIASQFKADYRAATDLLEKGSYDDACAAFVALKNYSDSPTKANESLYLKAESLKEAGSIDDAVAIYSGLGDYKDSADKINTCLYSKAEKQIADGQTEEAIVTFESISDYSDSSERAKVLRYDHAKALWNEGNLQAARKEYEALGNYTDSADLLVQVLTETADKAMDEKDYATALSAYQGLEQTDYIKEREYMLAQLCYDEGHFAEAVSAYENLGQYELSLSKLPIARYAWADQLFNNGEYEKAEEQFALLGDMTDSATRANESIYQLASEKLTAKSYDDAKDLFISITNYKDAGTLAKECDYRKAADLLAEGKNTEAEALFKSLGEYSDSKTKAEECIYNQADALLADKEYHDAGKMYDSIDFLDSKDKAKLSKYQEAETYYSGHQYAEAEVIFLSVKDYSDSAERAKDCRLRQGIARMDAGDYKGALEFFETIEYENSAELAAKCHYELGHISHLEGKTDEAVAEYAYAVSIPEARSALISAAKDYSVINEQEKAIQTLWLIRYQEEAQDELNKIAAAAVQNGKSDLAIITYSIFEKHSEVDFENLYQSTSYDAIKAIIGNCSLLPDDLEFNEYAMYHFAGMARDYGLYDVSAQAYADLGEYRDAATQLTEAHYQQAVALLNSGDADSAFQIFKNIKGYKDVDSLLVNDDNLAVAAAWDAKYSAGNYVVFGHYPQTSEGNDSTGIEWLVLAREGNKALLISRYGLDAKRYNEEYTDVTWEKCTLRTWLNGEFMNKAFTAQEQTGILTTNVDNSSSQGYSQWSTSGGNNTQDRIFLLSYAEANKYLGVTRDNSNNMESRAAPTSYAVKKGAYTSGSNKTADGTASGWWWLRSPGSTQITAVNVTSGGSLNGYYVSNDAGCVRPALWINLESEIF